MYNMYRYIYIYIVIGINTGNAKLKTPQISHALAVFPQTAQRQDPMLPVAAAKTRMVLRNPSWKAVHGKRMTGHSQMAPSGFRSTPTSGCLSLNRLQCMASCLKDLQRNWTKTGILCGFTLPKEVSKLYVSFSLDSHVCSHLTRVRMDARCFRISFSSCKL